MQASRGLRGAQLVLIIAALAAILGLWMAGFDSGYRTLFVEEFHSGEAGRGAYLFGRFQGEGGLWQSAPTSPAASLLTWLGLKVLGFGLTEIRTPFVLLSALSVLLFGLAVLREASRDRLLAFASLIAFVLAPFWLALRGTSVNETLYAPVLAGTFLLASCYESTVGTRARLVLSFGLAFVAGLAIFVKPDGAIIPAAAAISFFIRLPGNRRWLVEFLAFALGGVAIAAAYVATLLLMFGAEQYLAAIAQNQTIMAAVKYGPTSLLDIVRRVTIFAPKNIDLYYPLLPALLLVAVLWGLRLWRRLSLAGLIALVIVVGFFVAAPMLPLIYWKRLIFTAPALLYLCVAVWATSDRNTDSRRARIALAAVGALSIVYGGLCIGATFTEHSSLVMVWQRGWMGIATMGGAAAIAVVTAIGLLRAPAKTFRVLLLGVCAASIVLGSAELLVPRVADTRNIGQQMAAIFKDQPVVSDHNGFRFAGYFSKSPFIFVHENDTVFPNGIIEAARRTRPAFVTVSNTYAKLSALVEKELPDYVQIAHFSYVAPATRLNAKPATIETFIYRRK